MSGDYIYQAVKDQAMRLDRLVILLFTTKYGLIMGIRNGGSAGDAVCQVNGSSKYKMECYSENYQQANQSMRKTLH